MEQDINDIINLILISMFILSVLIVISMGFILSYIHTNNEKTLEAIRKLNKKISHENTDI